MDINKDALNKSEDNDKKWECYFFSFFQNIKIGINSFNKILQNIVSRF